MGAVGVSGLGRGSTRKERARIGHEKQRTERKRG